MLCCLMLAFVPLAVLAAFRSVSRQDVEKPLRWCLERSP